MPKITPFLWFHEKCEEAAEFYVSLFPNSKITHVGRHGEAGPGQKGSVMTVEFELDGQTITALNGGAYYTMTPATSLFVNCETQEEIDRYWDRLADGGTPLQCGWLTDRFGVTWQIVPTALPKYLQDPDPEKSKRTMQAMMKMVKLDIAALNAAYEGR